MGSLDRPKLRPLSAQRLEHGGRVYAALEDSLGVFTDPVLIPIDGYHCVVRHFDGRSSLDEIRERVRRESGLELAAGELQEFVANLDRAMVLDGPTYHAFRSEYTSQSIRPAAFSGRSYAGTERALRIQLDRFYAQGAGMPRNAPETPDGSLRAVVSPHIDFHRGGLVYTWAYKDLIERSDAEVFVVLGVAHQYCANRFALTRKHFDTPLGLVRTDVEYVDRLAELAGEHLFEDELAHRTEHSVEFQAVFLQHAFGGRREFRVVPILVGSFHDLMEERTDPIECDEVRRFIEALRTVERESGKKVAYIGGIDLSHVGPEFGDPERLDQKTLNQVRTFDETMLAQAAANQPAGWFDTAARVGNRWRVCGLAATYTMLHAIGPARGRLHRYQQAVDDHKTCCVSFASLTFEAHQPEADGRA